MFRLDVRELGVKSVAYYNIYCGSNKQYYLFFLFLQLDIWIRFINIYVYYFRERSSFIAASILKLFFFTLFLVYNFYIISN